MLPLNSKAPNICILSSCSTRTHTDIHVHVHYCVLVLILTYIHVHYCVLILTCTCTLLCTRTHTDIRVHTCTLLCTRTHTDIHTRTCTQLCTHTDIHVQHRPQVIPNPRDYSWGTGPHESPRGFCGDTARASHAVYMYVPWTNFAGPYESPATKPRTTLHFGEHEYLL